MWLAVWQPTPITADVTVTKIAGYVHVRILMNRCFFSYFWHSYIERYGNFVEYMNMHAAGCLTKQCGSAYYIERGRQVVHAMN